MKKLKIIRVIVGKTKNHRILYAQICLLACFIFAGAGKVSCQETESDGEELAVHTVDETSVETDEPALKTDVFYLEKNRRTDGGDSFKAPLFPRNTEGRFAELSDRDFRPVRETKPQREAEIPDEKDEPQNGNKEKFHWKPALIQSGIFLGIQHAARFTQQKTRRQLVGPFWRDWGKSVKSLRGWNDGDNIFINYVGHPLQGGLTGRIFVNNSDAAKKEEFGKSKRYWQSRFKAMAWSAFWSTQFELGPISEASIGNVGIIDRKIYSEMSYADLVVTPVAGTALLVGEDAIDKYVLKNWLERKAGKLSLKIKILRALLTPTTSFANLLRGKPPWKRDDRK